MRSNQIMERFSGWKMIMAVVIGILFISVFLSNLTLAFLQELLAVIKQFADDPEKVSFSLNWKAELIHFQKDLLLFYVGFFILVLIGVVRFVYNLRLNYSTLDHGQHGTGDFESVKNMKKQYKIIPASKEEYKGDGGVIIAGLQEKYRPYRLMIDDSPVHTLVIGITRSGKGETFVFPMVDVLSRAKNKPSLVINDPKGELAGASYETLVKRGYEVHVFNLIQQHMGMGFNPLQLVIDAWKSGNTSLAQQYANSVAYSLYHDPNAKDPFWTNSAKSLVTAIILALTEDSIATGREEKVNMYSVANFLSVKGSDNDEETSENALDLFFKARDENNPARMMYATSNFAAGNTRASIFSSAMDKLQIFTLEPNAKLTSYNSMNLTDIGFGDKPVAVFLVTPDFDKSNHVLASIFVSQLYRVNAEKATMSPNGKMQRQVHFMLDEFGNMPTIEGMAGMVTVGAGRGFRFHLIVQAYSQIKSQYGDDSDTIVGNCSNQIYILTKDKATAEQYSALIGNKTITDVSRSGRLLSLDKTHNESVKERPLMMADELMNNMMEGQSVVVRANKRQDKKRRKIVPKPIYNHGITAQKFRWQYLADDFDNSKSVMSLPTMSTTYHDISLSNIVFTSKSIDDQYVRMIDAMGRANFSDVKADVRNIAYSIDREFEFENEIEKWSFLHLLSYVVYDLKIPKGAFGRIANHVQAYITDTTIEEWLQVITDLHDESSIVNNGDLDMEREFFKQAAVKSG